MNIEPCKRDNTNDWVYAPQENAYICKQCLEDGIYNCSSEDVIEVEERPVISSIKITAPVTVSLIKGDRVNSVEVAYSQQVLLSDYNSGAVCTKDSTATHIENYGYCKIDMSINVYKI